MFPHDNLGNNRIRDYEQRIIDATGTVTTRIADATSYLLGLRYLTENDTTWIAEWYRNGTGYTENQLTDFSMLVDSGNPLLFNKAKQIGPLYSRPNVGEHYLYVRASQKEPFDIVYFTPSITTIINAADRSWLQCRASISTGQPPFYSISSRPAALRLPDSPIASRSHRREPCGRQTQNHVIHT